MASSPLFAGLISDENGASVDTATIGNEPCYVVNDNGFRRHIPSVEVDRQILKLMVNQVQGNENVIAEQTAKMLGQEDIFTKAMIQNQLKHIDEQIELLINTGIPEGGLAYMGMMGFKVVINIHGDIVRIEQPAAADEEGE